MTWVNVYAYNARKKNRRVVEQYEWESVYWYVNGTVKFLLINQPLSANVLMGFLPTFFWFTTENGQNKLRKVTQKKDTDNCLATHVHDWRCLQWRRGWHHCRPHSDSTGEKIGDHASKVLVQFFKDFQRFLNVVLQAIAYAALAGLGPQYGLYSAFAGSLVYIALGTCREVNIGPTALISLLTFTYAK